MATDHSTAIQLPLAIDGEVVEIPLTQGQTGLISAVDADLLEWKWHAWFHPRTETYYVRRTITPAPKHRQTIQLHRVILARILGRELLPGEQVDHVHHLTLDNRRSELRLATHGQNIWNRAGIKGAVVDFKGVYFEKSSGKWRAEIRANNHRVLLGRFTSAESAARAYDAAARDMHGEFAFQNFPDEA